MQKLLRQKNYEGVDDDADSNYDRMLITTIMVVMMMLMTTMRTTRMTTTI